MSKEMTFGKPSASPTCAEAMMPPTGPDSIIATGRSVAVSGVITPPFGGKHAAGLLDAGTADRRMHLAGGQEALLDLARKAARHQRAVFVKKKVVGLRPVAAADDIDVARTARDHEAGLGALAFDQRVDGNGRTMDQLVDRRSLDSAP